MYTLYSKDENVFRVLLKRNETQGWRKMLPDKMLLDKMLVDKMLLDKMFTRE
jgi:hypothetical protein